MQRVAELVVRELLPIEVAGEKILVGLHDRLDELLPVVPDAVGLFLGEVGDGFLRPLEHLAVQKVDGRLQVLVLADWHVQRHHAVAVRLAELLQYSIEVGVLAVEPADDDDARRFGRLKLRPHRLGADLDARGGVDEDDGGVRNAKPGVLVAGEVGKTRRVDEVDLDAVVGEGGQRHVDGDVPFLFLGVGVQNAGAVIDLAEAVRGPDRMEEGLDETRLSRSSVADDGHVSDLRGLR